MNIVHITHGKVNPHGESGMSRTVYFLNKYQKLAGHNSQIWSLVDGVKEHTVYKRDAFVTIEMFPRIFPFCSLKDGINNHIKSNRDKIDIAHFHIMWMYDKNLIADSLRKLKIPYIVTTHGAYTKDKIIDKWWKKIPAKYLYELKFLNNANAIHAVTYEELSALREFGVKTPVFVVPNGIELNEIPDNLNYNFFEDNRNLAEKIKFCWVGNLKPCKNIDGLIKAVSMLPANIREKIAIIIIGPESKDAKKYASYLKNLVREYNLSNTFYFAGPLYGKDKYNIIASSDIYIHPSWSEVISFAVLEAMVCAKPCIITRTSNVAYLYRHNFFIMVEPYPEDIARGIIEIIEKKEKWHIMGNNAKQLIQEEFTWNKIVEKIVASYANVIKNLAVV